MPLFPFENDSPSMKPLFICIGIFAAFFANDAMAVPQGLAAPRGEKSSSSVNLRRALPSLREGDIIFICFRHALYRPIAETSGSWESHVGILFRDSAGRWTVAQSTIPVSGFTRLESFVGRSQNGRFLVRRMRGGLSGDQVRRLRAAAETRMGKLYDTGFRYDSPRQFCSKFVYDSFLEATGCHVGRIETFREMFQENPAAPVAFWRTWFFGRIPWDRRSVTTTSQLLSPNFVTVFDTEEHAPEGSRRSGGTQRAAHRASRSAGNSARHAVTSACEISAVRIVSAVPASAMISPCGFTTTLRPQ